MASSPKSSSPTPGTPSLVLEKESGGTVLLVRGDWITRTIGGVEADLKRKTAAVDDLVAIDFGGAGKVDTAGALLLFVVGQGKSRPEIRNADERIGTLMRMVAERPVETPEPVREVNAVLRFLNNFGKRVVDQFHFALELTAFLGEYLVTVGQVARRPGRLPLTSLVYHMQQVGVAAIPIVGMLSFLIGLVIAYMGAQQLGRLGAQVFVLNLVEITTLRELGVLLTSILIAGRSGSSFTAQIGAMKSNEEVDAMRTMGLSPMLRLAFPRITALVLMLPALVFLADMSALLGGGIAIWTIMDMTPGAYLARMQELININNFYVGLVKAPFFAAVIGLIGCYQGFQVTGSAESVGKLTTESVVQSIFFVILLDAMFALFFMGIDV